MKNFFTVEEIEPKTITRNTCHIKNFNMIDSKKVLLEQSQTKKEVPKETLDKLKKECVLTEGLKEIFKKTNKTK